MAFLILTGAITASGRQPRTTSRVPAANSQGMLTIHADSQEKEKDVSHLRGHVVVTYQDMKVTADDATYDATSGEITARGHIVFTDPMAHLEATEAHYNVRTKKGWFLDSKGYLHARVRVRPRVLHTENPFYIRAARVERLSETNYMIIRGHITTCENACKGWEISARKAKVRAGDKVVSRDAVFHLLDIPVFYSPFLINSIAKTPRRTGFLLPHFGNSSQKGFIFGDGFFWAINPSADLLLGVENYSVRGVGTRGQFRAAPSADSNISINYFGVNDKGSGALRQVRAAGESVNVTGSADNLGDGFRGVVDVDFVNSLAFRETWSSNFSEAVNSEARQTGFITKNFDVYSFNVYVSRYQDFLSAQQKIGNSVTIETLPSFSFSGIDKQVSNTPLFFSFDTSATGVSRTEPGFETPDLSERLDVHPTVALRSKPFWGFHLMPTFGAEVTRYGTSLKPDGSSVNRVLGEFSIDLRPPSLEKIFSKTLYGYRFKHVIEPDIQYRLVRATDPQNIQDIVLFDQTDLLTETNEIEYSLTNSIMTSKASDSGDTPQAHDLISWRVAQKYYFDPNFGGALVPGVNNTFESTLSLTGFAYAQGRRFSPVSSVLKFSPFSNYDTELRTDISASGGGVLDAGITSNLHRGIWGVELTDFFVNRTSELAMVTPSPPATSQFAEVPSYNLLRTLVTLGNTNRRGLSGAFGVDYNFTQHIAAQLVSQASYNFGCVALDFEYRRFDLGPLRRENQFRIALSLGNVGTFGNLKPGQRLY